MPDFSGFGASQTSSLAATALQAEGSTLQTGSGAYLDGFGTARTERGTSTSHFEVAFDVTTPTAYRLTGSVSVAQGTPCCVGSTAAPEAHVCLRRSGGEVLGDVSGAIPLYSLIEQVGPLPLDQGGVLEPGSYVLEAFGTGSAAPLFFAQNYATVVASSDYQGRALARPGSGGGRRALRPAARRARRGHGRLPVPPAKPLIRRAAGSGRSRETRRATTTAAGSSTSPSTPAVRASPGISRTSRR